MGLPPSIDSTIREFREATGCTIYKGKSTIAGVGPLQFAACVMERQQAEIERLRALAEHLRHCLKQRNRGKQRTSMTVIYKYKLNPGRTVLELPDSAKVLTVQMQRDDACMWVLVGSGQIVSRSFDVYGTGQPMPTDPGKYVASFQMNGGALVAHVFESTRVGQI